MPCSSPGPPSIAYQPSYQPTYAPTYSPTFLLTNLLLPHLPPYEPPSHLSNLLYHLLLIFLTGRTNLLLIFPTGFTNLLYFTSLLIIAGPPGIGKTTAARVVLQGFGFDVVELNASDARSKKALQACCAP